MPTVLITDDEQKLRKLLARIVSLEGYKVLEAATLAEARSILQREPIDVLLCDVKLPDGSGVDFTAEVKSAFPLTEVVLLTAYGNIPDGVKAIRNGAFDYIVKGDDNDRILPLLSQAVARVSAKPRQQTAISATGFDKVLGQSPAILAAVALARKVAPTDTSVLLTGETGTGKEVFAQAIHHGGKRSRAPFVALNCSGFSPELLESTLFGHKAGAFTGALKDKKGLVEEAGCGTLFLDEIGEMPADLQPKLLRFLEDGSFYPVGDTKPRKADIRLISATNRQLQAEVDAGRFRSDLYYRIATFVVELPPLRARGKDIEILSKYFLDRFASDAGKSVRKISNAAAEALQRHSWKGNIRELKNVIERAVILEDGQELGVDSLPPGLGQEKTSGLDLAAVERAHILRTLAATGGNKAEAARLLNIGIATLYRKLDEYGGKSADK